jgi:eukaryotic-like serine/threonine-protein kinase
VALCDDAPRLLEIGIHRETNPADPTLARGSAVPMTSEQFGKAIVKAGLLSADDAQACWLAIPAAERPRDAEAFAGALVKAGRLTPFQAGEVLAGRESSLVFGDYLLLEKLGAGGMGEVFKARHRHMKRIVALKLVSPQAMKDEASVKRFQREVEAAARLEHPNIVTAHDARQDRGIHYLVMQYVEGSDLSRLVKQQGPLKVDLAIQCILQAAAGLAYAHEEGIVHRDIKPANLLLDKKGVVKILDMGLARLDDASGANLTGTDQVMGTIDYMSPEQGTSTHAVDARADIYSLGCTLWFLLTGRKVYEGDTLVSRMVKHRDAPIPSLCAARDDVPYALEQIYQRMVAKLPKDRYPSMDDVVRELENLQASASGLSRLAASDNSALNALNEFVASLDRGAAGRSGVRAKSPSPLRGRGARGEGAGAGAAGDAPTVDYREGGVDTDPKSEISVQPLAKEAGGTPKPLPMKLIGVCAAGLVVLLGAIVVIKSQKEGGVHRLDPALEFTAAGQIADVPKTAPPERPAPSPAIAPFDYKQARAHQQAWARYLGVPVEQKNSIGMPLVLIPPGEFLMGNSPEQKAAAQKMAEDANIKPDHWIYARLKAEVPQHRVTLTKPYWLGMTKVTIGQFGQFVEAAKYVTETEKLGGGYVHYDAETHKDVSDPKCTWRTPGYAVTDEMPVSQVTWNDAVMFCNWLSDQEKLQPCYRQDAKDGWVLLDEVKQILLPPGEGARRADEGLPAALKSPHPAAVPPPSPDGRGVEKTLLPPGDGARRADEGAVAAPGTPSSVSLRSPPSPGGRRENYGYRLPTEAEWEYACRAGTTTQFSYGDDPVMLEIYGWFGSSAHPVGMKVANAFGLFDMHGNVYEWCHDSFGSDYYSRSLSVNPTGPPTGHTHVVRGAGWQNIAVTSRSTARNVFELTMRSDNSGFRVVRMSVSGIAATTTAPTASKPSPPPAALPQNASPPAAKAPFDAAQAKAHQAAWARYLGVPVEQKNSLGSKMVLIPPGEFMMGSTPEQIVAAQKMAEDEEVKPDTYEWQRMKEEGPQHHVTLTRPYWFGMTEVTVGQFGQFVETTKYITETEKLGGGYVYTDVETHKEIFDPQRIWRTPGYAVTNDSPVTCVTWNDAVMFCNWLSEQEKLQPCYRQDAKDCWILLDGGKQTLLPPGEGGRRPDEGLPAALKSPHPAAAPPPSPDGRGVEKTLLPPGEGARRADEGAVAAPGTPSSVSLRSPPSPGGRRENYGYRLPTEAEWEYACRAGTTTQFYFGDDPAMLDIYGWCDRNSSGHAVGSKVANPFGLFDMHGNAKEWCGDLYGPYSNSPAVDPLGPSSGDARIIRGGRSAIDCRAAFRDFSARTYRFNSVGFRVVRMW